LLFPSPEIQTIELIPDCPVQVLRLDEVDPQISGNKWYKLKYNVVRAKENGYRGLLTFGGPNSNHIAATAAACRRMGLQSAGIIRGRAGEAETPTLKFAREQGMNIHLVGRETYALKNALEQQMQWQHVFPELLSVPEGGANKEGIKGAAEILADCPRVDYCCCACGTGTTFLGLLKSGCASSLLGFSVLKGQNTLPEELRRLDSEVAAKVGGEEVFDKTVIRGQGITNRFSDKGYAGYFPPAYEFSRDLKQRTGLQLDHVYTARLFYGVARLLQENRFSEGAQILLIHSGGLQGNAAFEARYGLETF
jgi:1-aminocyclopropane-1-carboxylate deaminase